MNKIEISRILESHFPDFQFKTMYNPYYNTHSIAYAKRGKPTTHWEGVLEVNGEELENLYEIVKAKIVEEHIMSVGTKSTNTDNVPIIETLTLTPLNCAVCGAPMESNTTTCKYCGQHYAKVKV